jgi:hypothetical protein
MTAPAADTLTFARDLVNFREHLQWAVVGHTPGTEPLADAFLALLDTIEASSDPLTQSPSRSKSGIALKHGSRISPISSASKPKPTTTARWPKTSSPVRSKARPS